MIVYHELLLKIEDAIAAERSAFAEGMADVQPESGACWVPTGGGRAIFTGHDFFSNRAMAMGLRGPVSPSEVERVETFYAEHGVPAEMEIATMVDRSLLRVLVQRGYQIVRFRNIYAQALPHCTDVDNGSTAHATTIEIQEVDASSAAAWSATLLDGFGYTQEADRARVTIWNQMLRSLPGVQAFIVRLDGRPVGAASMLVVGSAAVLGGAATIPAFRRRGVQRALIETRLAVATQAGCELAIVTSDPGSASGRNAERSGFQLICNHVNMRRPDGNVEFLVS